MTPRFRLEIQRPADGARFPGPPAPDGFFREVLDQVVFLGQRRGVIGPDAAEARADVQPILAGEDGQVAGVKVAAECDGRQVEMVFGIDLFAPLARLEIARLAKQGRLGEDDKVLYRVFAEAGGARSETVPQLGGSASTHSVSRPLSAVVARVLRKPLPLRPGRLGDWRAAAASVGTIEDGDYPLFVTESALGLARDYSRKPVDKEGGALLLGRLYRQDDPAPEIFGVIDDVIEAKYAEQKLFSLNLNTNGFAYLNGQLRLRRERLGRSDELPLGFAHAHNFLPSVLDDGQANCPSCPLRPTCKLSSSFYSAADVEFHRALFSRAPYAVGLVWGYTPREEDDLRAFHLDGGQARERGYYRIPDNAIPTGFQRDEP
ncbi:MAG TPA: hypothetical protein VMS17_04435 [Gemmataceae bacterium]|nr:hypothetical protein [Gemmataceae bacterium]